jgi:hypothetical protein
MDRDQILYIQPVAPPSQKKFQSKHKHQWATRKYKRKRDWVSPVTRATWPYLIWNQGEGRQHATRSRKAILRPQTGAVNEWMTRHSWKEKGMTGKTRIRMANRRAELGTQEPNVWMLTCPLWHSDCASGIATQWILTLNNSTEQN